MDLLLLPLLCSSWYPWKSPPEKFSSDNLSNLLLNKFLVLLSCCTLGCVATWTWLPCWWRSWLPWKWSTTMSLSESAPWSWFRELPTSTPESPLLGEVTMEVRWFPPGESWGVTSLDDELPWRKLELPWLPFPFCLENVCFCKRFKLDLGFVVSS